MSGSIVFRALLIGFAAIGAYGGGSLSLKHFHSETTCPILGPLPACYLVFASYALVALSALLRGKTFRALFYIGWAPIFALAMIGAMLHTFVGDTCPVNDNGMPQCYLSLALALLLFVLSAFAHRSA